MTPGPDEKPRDVNAGDGRVTSERGTTAPPEAPPGQDLPRGQAAIWNATAPEARPGRRPPTGVILLAALLGGLGALYLYLYFTTPSTVTSIIAELVPGAVALVAAAALLLRLRVGRQLAYIAAGVSIVTIGLWALLRLRTSDFANFLVGVVLLAGLFFVLRLLRSTRAWYGIDVVEARTRAVAEGGAGAITMAPSGDLVSDSTMRYAGEPPAPEVLLDVRDLKTHFHVMDGLVRAVDGVSFRLKRGESLGIVGESGSGKSVTALTIMRLLEMPPAEIADGEIWFDETELVSLPESAMRRLRGNDVAMIFQEPLTSLNPVFTVGDQIAEQVIQHKHVRRREAWDRAIDSLKLVGIPSPERRVKQYPHEMSGGMRQRVMIAMALSCEPKLLIADEPTTALDVTIQAQILELLKEIQVRTSSSLLLITHDLGVVAEMVDNVVVMYAGQVVEQGTTHQVLLNPKAPYSMGLIESIPSVEKRGTRLSVIKGTVASPFNMPPACRFEPRCPYAWDLCREVPPELYPAGGPGQLSRCHLHTHEGAGRRERLAQRGDQVAKDAGLVVAAAGEAVVGPREPMPMPGEPVAGQSSAGGAH